MLKLKRRLFVQLRLVRSRLARDLAFHRPLTSHGINPRQTSIQDVNTRLGNNADPPPCRRLFALPRFGANMNEVSMPRNGVPVLPASVSGKSCRRVLLKCSGFSR
jgi:hypothetical protein